METMQKWIRASFKRRLPLKRDSVWPIDLIFVWKPYPPKTKIKIDPGLFQNVDPPPAGVYLGHLPHFGLENPRPTPETLRKWLRTPFKMWLPLKRESILATDLILVWRPTPQPQK